MHPRIINALAYGGGLLIRADIPLPSGTLARAVGRGDLVAVLPGVYAAGDTPLGHDQRVQALMAADRTAVLRGESAAWAHRWPGTAEPTNVVASSGLRPRPGFALTRHTIPDDLVIRWPALRVTSVDLTALDLVATRGADAIDEALRQGVRLKAMHRALAMTPHRTGNAEVRTLLADSRQEPWSAAERAAHRALRAHRVTGWRANRSVRVGAWSHVADLVFSACRVIIEIDGRSFHGGWAERVRDHEKDRRLAAGGWVVIRFPAALVLNEPDRFVSEVCAVLAARSG